ncbi:unnamed protein product [marine sediment metagenome]|uniref:Thioredoxin-like fold domain-containing protein n=1 Tax=marine sediment metagenome TaxID=412755 RepID=X0RW73_9ZZZZ
MKIQILGPGCSKCKQLAENVEAAIAELGLECRVEKVTGIDEIIKFGVIMTPALAINHKVKITGKVASVEEIKELLK